ncbi:MAG: AAA family ATPase, partial [Bacteroidia bacterium]|nr:AAA family ATPase [Bacteroidia bacterium]
MEVYRPGWVQEFARIYFTGTISQFILHGNIVDYVRVEDSSGVRYPKLRDYLQNDLFKKRDAVIRYDRASGITFRTPEMRKDFFQVLQSYDTLHGTNFCQNLPRDPVQAFAILENYFYRRLTEGKKIAFIVDYADTLVPMSTGGGISSQDRALLVYLLRWGGESLFLENDMTVVLLTDSLQEMHQQIIRCPYTAEIEIPYPDEDERLKFIRHFVEKTPKVVEKLDMTEAVLAKNTAGMSLVQLRTLLAQIHREETKFTHKALTERKKAVIESEAGGLLEFVETKYDLDAVAGHAFAKKHLRAAAAALKNGRGDVLPMGYLINGPVGTGKTFLVACFAAEIGIPMVSLKNFRSQWQGVTEANLEKVLKLLKAMSPVAVMIDEADAYLGNRNMQGDSGVSSRVFSMIASFMSNTENRGKIIWFLLTARPDLMPVDLKRQGRAEEHIALFYPQTIEEKRELLAAMLKKTRIAEVSADDFDDEFFFSLTVLSGADMEAALTRAKFRAAADNLPVSREMIVEAFADLIPPTYPDEIELMNPGA